MPEDRVVKTGANLGRAVQLFNQGKYHAAMAHLPLLSNIKPVTEDTILAMKMSGFIYRHVGQFDNSIKSFTDALKEARRLRLTDLAAEILQDLEATNAALKKCKR